MIHRSFDNIMRKLIAAFFLAAFANAAFGINENN